MTNSAVLGTRVTGGVRLASLLRAAALVTALALLAIALRPAGHVFDMPLTEDGYYSLSVARNLAAQVSVVAFRQQEEKRGAPIAFFSKR